MNVLSGIFTNPVALNAQRNLGVSQNSLAGIQAQLSSGLRINGARDDAAGLAISDRLQANLKAQDSSIRSINEGISLVQVADGGFRGVGQARHVGAGPLQQGTRPVGLLQHGGQGFEDLDAPFSRLRTLSYRCGRLAGGR